MYLVISTSLSEDSRSRILARAAYDWLVRNAIECELLDLNEIDLPNCDGGDCYSNQEVIRVSGLIANAKGIMLATPIYNFDVGSPAKNLVELTGKSWTEKVVGFLCAAGGQGSYMGVMGLANSLMLDFRTFILPRFVYTTGDAMQGTEIADLEVQRRVEELTGMLVDVATALGTRRVHGS